MALAAALLVTETSMDAYGATSEALALIDDDPTPLRAKLLGVHALATADRGRDEEAARHAWAPAVMGCSELAAEVWCRDSGLSALELGDEAIVDAGEFTLEGRTMRNVRQMVNRVGRQGYVAEIRREIRDFRDQNTRVLNALRQDLVEGFARVDEKFAQVDQGFTEIRGKLDVAAAGQQQIAGMLGTLIARDDGEAGPG